MNSDQILVMEGGRVAEEGRFRKLARFRYVDIEEDDEEEEGQMMGTKK